MPGNTAKTTAEEYRHGIGPADPVRTADRATLDADQLIQDVHDLDPRQVWGRLTIWAQTDPDRLKAVVIALAAAHPPDTNIEDALAWTNTLARAAA